MEELWKPVANYEGLYEVSNLGRIRSVDHFELINSKGGHVHKRFRKGQVLVQSFDGSGHYLHVRLQKNGLGKSRNVHRIVAETWIPNPNMFPEVNHIDENKCNNSVENLEWCDRKYNNNYGSKLGSTRGAKNPQNKFSEETITALKSEYIPNDPEHGLTPLAKKYGISVSHVCSIIKGRRWEWL